jgi:hypothetical protein
MTKRKKTRTNNDLQNTTQKAKDPVTPTTLKTQSALKDLTVPVLLGGRLSTLKMFFLFTNAYDILHMQCFQ